MRTNVLQASALLLVVASLLSSCSTRKSGDTTTTVVVTSVPTLSRIFTPTKEMVVSKLEQNINELDFRPPETTVEDLNRKLGQPSSQDIKPEGTLVLTYSGLPHFEFKSLFASVDTNKDTKTVEEILLGLEKSSPDIVRDLGSPSRLFSVIPTPSDLQKESLPPLTKIYLWWPKIGALLEIACNSNTLEACRKPSREGFGFMYLLKRNASDAELKPRLLMHCPDCTLVENPWQGFSE